MPSYHWNSGQKPPTHQCTFTNEAPPAALKDETPFERLFGRRPDISQLKVFGCVSYVNVPDNQRRKLDAKAHKAIFVGYPPGVKGY